MLKVGQFTGILARRAGPKGKYCTLNDSRARLAVAKRPQKGRNKAAGKVETTQQLRIIGGQWRGRKISFPAVDGLRPTGDRMRETLFNWIAPDLPGATCVDLFAGSGALGLESLSRGASWVTLLEKSRQGAQQLRANLQLLGADNATVIETNSLQWLDQPTDSRFDVVFIDPPFAAELWQQAFALLIKHQWLNAGAAIYIEAPRHQVLEVPNDWQLHREKKAGDVCYRLYYYQP